MIHAARLIPAAALLTALAACGHGGPAYGPANAGVAATVAMNGFAFEPASVTIKSGETVEWRNRTSFSHTVTFDPKRNPDLATLPPGAGPPSIPVTSQRAGCSVIGL